MDQKSATYEDQIHRVYATNSVRELQLTKLPFPGVEDLKLDASFLSLNLDALRTFHIRPFPWNQTKVSEEAIALRDQKFER